MTLTNPVSSYIDIQRGLIRGEIFHDREIYELELERVFARSWVFIAHETMLPTTGSFIQNYVGEDPILVVRQQDGSIRAFLNQCQHRGMRLCRADLGETKNFMCSFHGWNYNLAGKLINVPHGEATFAPEDLADVKLREMRVTNYKGFIFGNWDENAPNFEEYMGDFAWYFDSYIDRYPGGMEVVGTHKWVLPCNWKFNAEQPTSDMYHGETSHMSAFEVMLPRKPDGRLQDWAEQQVEILADAKGGQFSSPYGHGAGWFDVGVPVLDKTIFDWKKRTSGEVAKRLGENRVYIPGHANLFPNFMMLGANTFRVTHPRGPNEMEIWSWSMAPVAAPPEVKDAIRVDLLRTFSGAGMLEQDDAVNWEEEQAVLRGFMARSEHLKYRQLMNKARYDHNGYPGKTVPHVYSEQAARDMYLHYSDLMSGAPWPELVKLKAERVEQERQACGKNNFLNPAEA